MNRVSSYSYVDLQSNKKFYSEYELELQGFLGSGSIRGIGLRYIQGVRSPSS